MALPNVADARKLSDEELSAEITTAKQKLFELRMQRATRRLEKTHEFKHMRHWIAQLLTVERERQIAIEQANPEPSAEPAAAEPVVAEAAIAEPMVAEPVIAEPVVAEPVSTESVSAEPTVAESTSTESTSTTSTTEEE